MFFFQYHTCRISRVLLEYSKTAMFMWMFIEGLYLHNIITVTVFQEYRYMKIYIYIGWISPAFLTLIWLLVMIYYSMEGWVLSKRHYKRKAWKRIFKYSLLISFKLNYLDLDLKVYEWNSRSWFSYIWKDMAFICDDFLY